MHVREALQGTPALTRSDFSLPQPLLPAQTSAGGTFPQEHL